MDQLKRGKSKTPMKKKTGQSGFSYLEVMIAIVILTVGIMAQLSAMSFSMFRASESEQRNAARQIASSTIESIFSARDLGNSNGISNFNAINLTTVHANGIFLDGWRPIREDSGIDGILGTADDACSGAGTCTVGAYTNSTPVLTAFDRQIVITDIVETGVPVANKRRIDVKIRYFVGQVVREEVLSTIIADLPFYD
jgi:prepilin-type N-terminal cleavage/methylation domain-containing protein